MYERMFRFLVKITKNEAKLLHERYGVLFSEYGGINHTLSCHGKRKTYYLTESKKNLNALRGIRNNIVK